MKNIPINDLVDVLIEEKLKTTDTTRPYYKLWVTKEASRQVFAFETMCLIDHLLSFDGVDSVSFEFTQEYNDEGGTYLSTSGSVKYKKKVKDKILSETLSFYSGGWDELDDMFDDAIMEQFSEEEVEGLRDAISKLSDQMGDFTDEDVEVAYKFYDATFTKGNVHSLYREVFPDASACIEKYLIEKGLESQLGDNKSPKAPYKM